MDKHGVVFILVYACLLIKFTPIINFMIQELWGPEVYLDAILEAYGKTFTSPSPVVRRNAYELSKKSKHKVAFHQGFYF